MNAICAYAPRAAMLVPSPRDPDARTARCGGCRRPNAGGDHAPGACPNDALLAADEALVEDALADNPLEGSVSRTPRIDPEQAANVRAIVLRYYLGGERRGDLSREYGYSERQIQGYVGGRAISTITAPLVAQLAALGLTATPTGGKLTHEQRHLKLALAATALLAEAEPLLVGLAEGALTHAMRAEAAELLERVRLLVGLLGGKGA